MKVWRFESVTGVGVFMSQIADEVSKDLYNMPGPRDDHILRDKWKPLMDRCETHLYVFGFRSIEQARASFHPKHWPALERHGAVVCEYECPDDHVITGAAQVAFNRHKGRCVAKHNPTSLLTKDDTDVSTPAL